MTADHSTHVSHVSHVCQVTECLLEVKRSVWAGSGRTRLKSVQDVVRAPFRAAFAEPWGHDHRNGEKLARTLGPFVRNPSVLRLLPASTLAMMS